MRSFLAVSLALTLAGCVTGREPSLAAYENITYGTNMAGHEIVSVVAFQYPFTPLSNRDALPICVTRVISNTSVNLSDASRSWVGPYTGRYYSVGTEREVGGGEVLQYVAEDKNRVTARGVIQYRDSTGLLPIGYAVRFNLVAKVGNEGRVFSFEKIERAQLSTGVVANDGFSPLGAWAGGAAPQLAIAELNKVANELNACLSN